MFQVKDFPSIVASMINHARATQTRLTDFNVGAVGRTLMEAPAIELDEFYQRVLFGLLEAIPVAVYEAFDFAALPATHASGTVRFSSATLVDQPVPIPAGTVVKVPEDRRRYVTIEASSIPANGSYVDVRVAAESAGEAWNARAGEITELVTPTAGVDSVTNLNPLSNGTDGETPEDRRRRFVAYINSLSRGTVSAVEYAVRRAQILSPSGLILEYVTRVGIVEEAGRAYYYVYGSDGLPSADLLRRAQDLVDGYIDPETERPVPGYRPVGVDVQVKPMVERSINVALRVNASPSVEGTSALLMSIRDAVSRAITSARPGDILYADQVTQLVLSVRGVLSAIYSSDDNVVCEANEALVLGDLDVEWVS